ncbi:hypothetical protein [Enterocloster citroniae]|uniref:hypothetical protein n=1 Tax=Enterocloster citroniae TaxID=358743 RepID=UPI0022E41E5B|nr:hypothetical protein [Enterocloster citroniae]
MTVMELIALLKKAPPDDIVLADIEQEGSAGISGMLTTSAVLVGNGTIRGITCLKMEPYED